MIGYNIQWHTFYVGLLWTRDQPVAETSTWQNTALTRDNHDPCEIRTHNPSKLAAADLGVRPRRPPGTA